MERFSRCLRALFPHPAIDHTGLKKAYDFTLKLAFGGLQTQDDYVRAYTERIRRNSLGCVVAPGGVCAAGMVVDSVDRTPTPNTAGHCKADSAAADLEFEVASHQAGRGQRTEAAVSTHRARRLPLAAGRCRTFWLGLGSAHRGHDQQCARHWLNRCDTPSW